MGLVKHIAATKTRIIVVGDVILDVFTTGDKERMSSEAPVPVVRVNDRKYLPGGAGNVAANIAVLGGETKLVSVIGAGYSGSRLQDLLKSYQINIEGLVIDLTRRTSRKERILIGTEQIVCVADETRNPVDHWVIEKVAETLESNGSDIIILSDYNRGMINEILVSRVIEIGNRQNKRVLADVHIREGFDISSLKGVYLFTPNRFEAAHLVDIPVTEIGSRRREVATKLVDMMNINVLLTIDGDGMVLALTDGKVKEFPAIELNPVCVSGAGDTVVGTIAVSLAAGIDIVDAVMLSSLAAAVAVKKPATSTVSLDELKKYLTNM